jgi:hypothetical protein
MICSGRPELVAGTSGRVSRPRTDHTLARQAETTPYIINWALPIKVPLISDLDFLADYPNKKIIGPLLQCTLNNRKNID